jgi:hypothetical protein
MPTPRFDGSKPGPGRPKGSAEKFRFNAAKLWAALQAQDYDPIVESIAIARDPTCPHVVKFRINEMFLKLIVPKPIDHNHQEHHGNINISWNVAAPQLPEEHTVSYTVIEPESTPVIANDDESDR